jgi:hypothetical protein
MAMSFSGTQVLVSVFITRKQSRSGTPPRRPSRQLEPADSLPR